MIDQAENLRKLVNSKSEELSKPKDQPKVYSIISGKGGVGKTSVAVNLAIDLSKSGQRVLILDADIGMSNANILLGEQVQSDIFEAIDQDKDLREVIIKSKYGIDLLSGGSDFFYLESLNQEKQDSMLDSLSTLEEYDSIIIDNGAGMNRQSLAFTILGDEIILVTTPEPTAITDAYRVLKLISLYDIKSSVNIIVNQVKSKEDGLETFEKLKNTANQFLGLEVKDIGFIYSDTRVNKATMDQVPYVAKSPSCPASKSINNISNKLLGINNSKNSVGVVNRIGNKILKIFG